jgi:pimeloyl-ACP methyl ester carboxylesterase
MHLALDILLLIAVVVVATSALFLIVFYRRPIATAFWLRRMKLRRAGLRRMKLSTTVGKQVVWHGGTGPVLVLLHGAGDQAGTWYSVAPELMRSFQLVIPDLAGHGESEPYKGVLSLGTLLAALEQVLDANEGQGQPILLVGNSLGAWMSMLYAEKHPQRVRRVILIDGGPIRGVSTIGLMPRNREEARKALDSILDASTPRRPNFVLDDMVRVSNAGPISRLLAAGEEDLSKYLLEDKLANFPVPVDLVWGASDRLVPPEYAKKLQSKLPQCTFSVLDRCGHAPQLECPYKLTKALLQLLIPDWSDTPATERSAPGVRGERS